MKKTLILLAVLLLESVTIYALATRTFEYKCPKCNLVQSYGITGVYRCPKDNYLMVPVFP